MFFIFFIFYFEHLDISYRNESKFVNFVIFIRFEFFAINVLFVKMSNKYKQNLKINKNKK